MADVAEVPVPAGAGPETAAADTADAYAASYAALYAEQVLPHAEQARRLLAGRTVWHVNTAAVGGGVAEMLQSTVRRHDALGVRSRWLVLRAGEDFFTLTKQLHHLLHGSSGTGLLPDAAAAELFAATGRQAAGRALEVTAPGDVVLIHDPQPLGMANHLAAAGRTVLWRSHIGTGTPGPEVDAAWRFLEPHLREVRRFVFHSPDYVPPGLPPGTAVIIPPGIDAGSAKCRDLTPTQQHRLLAAAGLLAGGDPDGSSSPDGDDGLPWTAIASYTKAQVRVLQDAPLDAGTPYVLQLARWDPLKDMPGTLTAFAEHVAPRTPAHLVLAGPDPADIADDPENLRIVGELVEIRRALAPDVRSRVHLVLLGLPRDARGQQANHLVVNGLQRHATVVVQKSLQEGFGLAVAEAMWKRRAVVAGAVGGIRQQIRDGVNGLLVPPADLAAFGAAVTRAVQDPQLRARLGDAAHAHCADRFLTSHEDRRLLETYAAVLHEGSHA